MRYLVDVKSFQYLVITSPDVLANGTEKFKFSQLLFDIMAKRRVVQQKDMLALGITFSVILGGNLILK